MSFLAELRRRNVIRVLIAYLAAAWFLIQIADVLWPIYGLSESSLQVLTNLLGIGLIPAIIVSWAFEWTPEGLKRDADVAPGESIAPQVGKTLDRIIMVVLALAVGFFAFDKFVLDPVRDAEIAVEAEGRGRIEAMIESFGDKSIAVLPFVNMSSDPEQDFFSDGVSEEILNLLAKIKDLRVISRSSAFEYRGDVHIPTVAAALNVAYVLEGSVRKAGDSVRITAQLIDARADTHVWSETWDRELTDIFEIQDEVALSVSEALQLKLLGQKLESRRIDPVLYMEYLALKNELDDRTPSAGIIRRLEELVEAAPDYVPAINLLSLGYFYASGVQTSKLYSPQEGYELSIAAVRRALSVDPDDAFANAVIGWNKAVTAKDLHGAARGLQRAYELEPGNAEVLSMLGPFARMLGRLDDAVRLAEMSVVRDPQCPTCYYRLGQAHLYAGNYERAEWAFRERMRMSSGGWISIGRTLLLRGRYTEALDAIDRQEVEGGYDLPDRAMVYYSQGRIDEFNEAVEQLLAGVAEEVPDEMAMMFAWSGDLDRAFEWLNNVDNDGRGLYRYAQWDPFLQNLKQDPRFSEYLARHGMTRKELATVEFNIFDD